MTEKELGGFYHELEYDSVCTHIAKYFVTEESESFFRSTRPFFHEDEVIAIQTQVREISLRTQVSVFPQREAVPKIRDIMEMGKKRSFHLDELSAIVRVLAAIMQYRKWMADTSVMDYGIDEKTLSFLPFKYESVLSTLYRKLSSYFDAKGSLKRESIPALITVDEKRRRVLHDRSSVAKHFIQTHSDICAHDSPTIRGERLVIPIKTSYKSRVKGIIHDVSSSSQTVFMEPQSLFEINNDVETLQLEELQVIYSLCRELSEYALERSTELLYAYHCFIEFDVAFAQLQYSLQYKGRFPSLTPPNNDMYEFFLPQARHPLIDGCVPITIMGNKSVQQLILTGPNAGGKTVALKTMGLLVLMNQSGIPIPVEEGAFLPVFGKVGVAMGDHQDISMGESTFSSHLRTIHTMLSQVKHAGDSSQGEKSQDRILLLFDEFCGGTDEQEGGTLAWALLEYLLSFPHCFAVVTTHSTLLKRYALMNDAVTIAALEHDAMAQYNILYNTTGKSEAITLAKRMGFQEEILERQAALLKEFGSDTQALMYKLYDLVSHTKKQKKKASFLYQKNREAQRILKKKMHKVRERELSLKREQYHESTTLFKQMRAHLESITQREHELHTLIKEYEKAGANVKNAVSDSSLSPTHEEREKPQVYDEKMQEIRSDLTHFQSEIEKNYAHITEEEVRMRDTLEPIEVGEEVIVRETGVKGTVLSVSDNDKYTVQAGIVSLTVRRDMLSTSTDQEEMREEEQEGEKFLTHHFVGKEKDRRSVSVEYQFDRTSLSDSSIPLVLSVRGKSTQEALDAVHIQLDRAVISHISFFSILHGKGYGILARAIHALLKEHTLVKSYRYADLNDGGQGKTYVFLE